VATGFDDKYQKTIVDYLVKAVPELQKVASKHKNTDNLAINA